MKLAACSGMKTVHRSLEGLKERLPSLSLAQRLGRVTQVRGLVLESEGPDVALGDIVEIFAGSGTVPAEVVGFSQGRMALMPLAELPAVRPGCQVLASGMRTQLPLGEGLMGRVIDGLGRPLDDKGPIQAKRWERLRQLPPHPLKRRRIDRVFSTGVRAIDLFAPMGCGQRMGIFSGSGVGKSTLLGMIARGAQAEVNVIALIGERGRELREFIEEELGPEGLAKSVVVVATSDQMAPLRIRAARLATRIAESFRDAGQDVLLLMDSVTRFAMAQREIGLAIGEPPTSRGYTPSVFSMLPKMLERSGMGETGSITAFYTVLVEGDDLNEPITDTVRGILDGHIVLERSLASSNHYPAISVLDSLSRLSTQLMTRAQGQLIAQARDLLSLYRNNEDLIQIGAVAAGVNAQLDRAIELTPKLNALLRQASHALYPAEQSWKQLHALLQPGQDELTTKK